MRNPFLFFLQPYMYSQIIKHLSLTNPQMRKKKKKYLEPAIFKEKADRTSLEEESVANNFANASKVDASAGTSRDNVL